MRLGHLCLPLLFLTCGPSPALAAEPPALAEARMLYNAASYDEAIAAASVARLDPEWADTAALVIARAHLERYRRTADPVALTTAREMLVRVRSEALAPRDRVDLLIGLGQALYLGELFGAAGELFDTALSRSALLSERDRLMLLDWWATAVDREAQSRPVDARRPLFERLAARMEEELRQDAGNPVANYWLAVAARGAGNLERAWNAAIAAWVRSSLSPESAEQLRIDLDRLVTQALVHERARQRPPGERRGALAALQSEWERVKAQWK